MDYLLKTKDGREIIVEYTEKKPSVTDRIAKARYEKKNNSKEE